MNEWIKKRPEESFREYRERYFSTFSQYVRVVGKDEYQTLYQHNLEFCGVNSPAFVDIDTQQITICDDVPDKDYINFLKHHEMWEDFIINKMGISLRRLESIDEIKPTNKMVRPAHRFALYKELCLAREQGKLDKYMGWWRDFYSGDIDAIHRLPYYEIERISRNYIACSNQDKLHLIISNIRRNWELREQMYRTVKSL